MLDKIKKIKENKILKIIGNTLYIAMFIIVILMLAIVLTQRITNNNVTIGGIRIFSVATGSMIPVYNVGDVLIAKEVEIENVKVGDDIVYQGEKDSYKGKVVTHRVKSIEKQEDENYKIITQGVANNTQDPEINQTQVYGKIVCKSHILSFLSKITKNIYAFYVIMFIPVAVLIYRNIKNILNMNNNEEENEQ